MAKAKTDTTAERLAQEDSAAVSEQNAQAVVRNVMKMSLPASEIQPAGIKWEQWNVFCLKEHDIEDVLAPDYLYAKRDQIRSGHYIEIKHPLGYFVVCLDVVRVDHEARAIVSAIRHIHDYRGEDARFVRPALESIRYENLGDRGWSVVMGNEILADHFADKASAERWVAEKRAA